MHLISTNQFTSLLEFYMHAYDVYQHQAEENSEYWLQRLHSEGIDDYPRDTMAWLAYKHAGKTKEERTEQNLRNLENVALMLEGKDRIPEKDERSFSELLAEHNIEIARLS